MSRNLRVYVLPSNAGLSFSEVDRARTYLRGGEFERAHALLERAHEELRPAESSTEYGIKVRYNYSRSLLDLCLRKSYATCGQAERNCRELETERQGDPKHFGRLGITQQDLEDCSKLAQSVAADERKASRQAQVQGFTTRVNTATQAIEGRGDRAGEGATALATVMKDLEESPVSLEDLRISEADFYRRAALGYVRYTDHLRRAHGSSAQLEEQKKSLSAAIKYLEAAGELESSPSLRRDLTYARYRLDQVARDGAAGHP
jgi:tetratricopeptide (TPR) repeat protein